MKYPYFRGLEADRYSFYRVPKALIKVDLFEKMSGDAKLLYAVLLDRMNLSLKNGWQDENGNAYIICTIDEIMDYGAYCDVSLDAENKDDMVDFNIGDEVIVYYDGNIAESYPLQINTVYAISLKDPAN